MDKQSRIHPLPPRNSRFAVLRRGSVLLLAAGASGLLFACSYGLNPLTPGERTEILTSDRTALFTRQEPVTRPISLFEAMARALKYNLSHRVALLEKAVAQRQLDLTQFELLPQIGANSELKGRNNPEASKGYSITDRQATNSYSTAQDQLKATAKLTTAWNVLDFGVSAIQASQDADRTLIANENQRKAVHTLLQEVRSTFWRAAGAQKLEDAIGPVIQQARNALADARQVERERLKPQLEILRYQKTLLEIVRQLQDLRHQLSLAKTEFAALINLPPGSAFQLEIPDDPALTIPEIRMTVEEMEMLAMDNRPDVREALYAARISRGDVRKALLRLLPGLEFQVGHNWDSNSFALHSQWEEASSRVVLNIMNLLQGPTAIRLAENKEELVNLRRLTLQMAILTQVHLAYHQYVSDQRKLAALEEIDAVEQRIFKNSSVTTHNDAQSRLEQISAAASAIMSRLQLYQAYADAQNSVGRIFVTLGVDLAPKASRSDEIEVLTDAMREAAMEWDAGLSSSPMQKLLDSLSRPSKGKGAAKGGNGAYAIPDYFLEPQFMHGLMDSPTDRGGQEGAAGDRIENDLRPTPSPPSRLFGAGQSPTQADARVAGPGGPQERSQKPSAAEDPKLVKLPAPPEGQATPTAPGQTVAPPQATTAKAEPSKGTQSAAVKAEPAKGEQTPVVQEAKPSPTEDAKTLAEVQEMVHAWAKAWSQRVPEAYWSFYAADKFVPAHSQTLEVWRQRTRETLNALTFLQVEVDNLELLRDMPEPLARLLQKGSIEFLPVAFRESYRSNRLQSFSRKLMILGKEADGWKIFREAASLVPPPGAAAPAGYAVQVAAMEMTENSQKILEEWTARGFQPVAVAVMDEKKQRHLSIRLAHFRDRDRALFFRWLLQLATGVETFIVPAEAADLVGVAEATPPQAAKGEKGVPEQEKGAVDKPVSKKEQKDGPGKKSGRGDTEDAEVDR
ncbi:MAG: TolC family protein [Magnetococcus sp. MYC-9]